MQSSEAYPIFSALSQPNGNRRSSQLTVCRAGATDSSPRLVSTKELSKMWDMPESTLRYWRCAGIGPLT
jgi:hypothetical protein